jgi:hypothetical protein
MAIIRHTGVSLMDRRCFVARTGLLVAASAVASSLLSCTVDTGIDIPCLGTTPAPEPVPGMTYIRASEIGCALDCDLSNGRNKYTKGNATDDGPRINAAMASASASNPITLIIDGSALISGLFLPVGGYWSIVGLGCGTGFFIKSGTDNDGIHNGGPRAAIPFDPGPPVPARGTSVSLRNFTINGNQGNGRNGDSTTGMYQGITGIAWYCPVNLMNLDNIDIENVVVVNSPAYHMRFSNVGNVSISGCVLRSQGSSTDGLHFDGSANDIAISNCDFTTGDDSIALNCGEGYFGNISRVSVTNCTFDSWTLMRLNSIEAGHKFNIDTVSVSNCTGKLQLTGFVLGQQSGANPESISGLTISDCNLTAPCILDIGANFGNISLTNLVFTPLQNAYEKPGLAFVRSSPDFAANIYSGTNLTFDSCVIQRNADLSVAALIVDYNSFISNLVFNGFSVKDDKKFSAVPQLINLVSGSLDQLLINVLDSSNIKEPVSPAGFSAIETVSGTGVLATEWEFPDNVMADGVPYLSASTGLPSIKIGSLIEPYTG